MILAKKLIIICLLFINMGIILIECMRKIGRKAYVLNIIKTISFILLLLFNY